MQNPEFRRQLPRNWLRSDALTAVVLAVMGALMGYAAVVSGTALIPADDGRELMVSALIISLPMVFYRRFPEVIAMITAVTYMVVGYTLGIEIYTAQVVLYLSFYAVGAWSNNRRRAHWVRVLILAVMAAWLLVETVRGFSSPETGEVGVFPYFAFLFMQWVINFVFFGAAWFFGQRAWNSAAKRAELDAAHAQIRNQQEVIAEHAIEVERVRIARELHDTVAHHVTVMGVQAAAARRMLDTDQDAAREQLRGVESASRQAVHELQNMVRTLRDTAADPAPMPTISDLGELITQARSAGQKIEHEIVDDEVPGKFDPSPAVELTVYRVVQESLSNARKYAGPNAVVSIIVRYLPNGVEVDVSDDGWGAPIPVDVESNGGAFRGTGTGVLGMAERVRALDGKFEAGPKKRGGWLVRAWVPISIERGSSE